MKNSNHKLAVFLFLIAGVSMMTFGQSRSSESEQERERESRRAREEFRDQEMQKKLEEMKMQEEIMRVKADKMSNYVIASPDGSFFFTSPNSGQSSQLSLSKSFDGESTKNEGSFDVDENVSYINFTVNGSVKEGKIRINIHLPGGEALKEMTIDNTADIQYTQMIRPKQEDKKYGGKWTYKIEADKAVGHYQLSIQTK